MHRAGAIALAVLALGGACGGDDGSEALPQGAEPVLVVDVAGGGREELVAFEKR